MSIYWEIGVGWEPIVQKAAEGFNGVKDPLIEIDTVKEKYGGLRIHVRPVDPNCILSPYTEKVNEIIEEAEKEAAKTCEFCGSKENITRKGSWLKTLCASCHEKREKELRRRNVKDV